MAQDILTPAEFEQLVKDIAVELDGDWTVSPHTSGAGVDLTRADGDVHLGVYYHPDRDPSRLRVFANWGDDTLNRHIETIVAKVSIERSPKVLARDITRRVIDPFVPKLALARQAYEEYRQRVTDAKALREKIGATINETFDGSLRFQVPGKHEHDYLTPEAQFDVEDDRALMVSVNLKNLTSEQGEAIAAWVRDNLVSPNAR